jgi:hypothetical protein
MVEEIQYDETVTPEEAARIEEALRSYGSPVPDEKHNIHSFLHKINTSTDTTKTGFLTSDEVGLAKFPLRTYKEMELNSTTLCDDELLSEYMKQESEILTSTSLSKEGKFLNLAVEQRKEWRDTSRRNVTSNKSWFRSKQPVQEQVLN